MVYYKALKTGRISPYKGWQWPEPGIWTPPVEGDLVHCKHGYHLCRKKDLVEWFNEEIWIAEGRGTCARFDDKVVFGEARLIRKLETWNRTTARLFAADCAEHVLPIFERRYPDDDRPRKAIEAARAFARGEVGREELDAAARAAAWDAARAAARAARAVARSAERRWQTRRLFEYLEGKRS